MVRVCQSKPKFKGASKGPDPGKRTKKHYAYSSKRSPKKSIRFVDEGDSNSELESDELDIHQVKAVSDNKGSLPPIKVHVGLDDCIIPMEVDTGAAMSIMAVRPVTP